MDMFKAVRGGRLYMVKDLCDHGANVDSREYFGYTALILAIRYGQHDIAKELCDRGANLDGKDTYGTAPLIWAVRYEEFDIVKELCVRGANLDIRDKQGFTALALACSGHAHYDIRNDGDGDTAVLESHVGMIKVLCIRGARVFSARSNNPEISQILTKQTYRHHVLMMICAHMLPVDVLRLLHEFV